MPRLRHGVNRTAASAPKLRVRPALVIRRPVVEPSGKTVSCWLRQSIQNRAKSPRTAPSMQEKWPPSS